MIPEIFLQSSQLHVLLNLASANPSLLPILRDFPLYVQSMQKKDYHFYVHISELLPVVCDKSTVDIKVNHLIFDGYFREYYSLRDLFIHEINHGSQHEGVILKNLLSAFCFYRNDSTLV